jgi:DNA mismatch repair protein MutS
MRLSGEYRGSVLHSIDRTLTASGGRLLAARLQAPSMQYDEILQRLAQVEWGVQRPDTRNALRDVLKHIPDAERATSRLLLGRGGPRDLLAIKQALEAGEDLAALLSKQPAPDAVQQATQGLYGLAELTNMLRDALAKEVPHLARDGGFIAPGFRADLDEYRRLSSESKRIIAAMEQELRAQTGISSLKIKQNNVIGYFIEITQIHEKKVPDFFIHRQGLAGSLRYSTVALNELARAIEDAASKALGLELELFTQLVDKIRIYYQPINSFVHSISQLDVAMAMAYLAEAQSYVKPDITADYGFDVQAGRHPVVEAALKKQHEEFASNNCNINKDEFVWLITGPNMSGKSTFLRQNALIQILAQMGGYVPASGASLSLADRVFCRVGAGDDLARGQSTFMVEMAETSAILRQATRHSLVVLDEIGRGTATYDGMAIAQAVLEYLHDVVGCKTLFATHYHELTDISSRCTGVRNYHAEVKEHRGNLVFMHRIRPGCADRSYGIQVAALAGIPAPVIARAKQLLHSLEEGGNTGHSIVNLPLFSQVLPDRLPDNEDLVLKNAILSLNLNEMTPKAALDALFELKNKASL